MKTKLGVAIALASLAPAISFAEPKVYGKANVSFENTNVDDQSYTSLLSNASRIGLKGSEELSGGVQAIYKFEYETFVDDGDKSGKTFTQRNIYVGLKGGFGQVIAGNFDTPTKQAQGKVDQFNDLSGDIKNVITVNDRREADSIMYTTPGDSFNANIAYINSETEVVDPGFSASVTFSSDVIYAALAYDQDVGIEAVGEEFTTIRGVIQAKLGPVELGALVEQYDADANDDKKDGVLVSVGWKLGDTVKLKAQYGQSDQVEEGGETASLGADFKYTDNVKSFVYYTMETGDRDEFDNDYLGVGMEYKF